jgi:hypothetical protein
VLPLYQRAQGADDDVRPSNGASAMTADEVVEVWAGAARGQSTTTPETDDDGFTTGPSNATGASPRSAGLLQNLDPRNIVRTLTVYQMKDRAATIGGRGLGPLLTEMLSGAKPARVHLVGHSYGAKVVLSALSQVKEGAAKADSVLLLQPAVNGWCFAGNVNNRNYPGGYRGVLERVRQPILTTYTKNDSPLTKFFHLAVRRRDDLGELKVAMAGRPKPPNEFGALGGFRPAGLADSDCQFIDLKPVGESYDLTQPLKVWALNGDAAIRSHGEVEVRKRSGPSTARSLTGRRREPHHVEGTGARTGADDSPLVGRHRSQRQGDQPFAERTAPGGLLAGSGRRRPGRSPGDDPPGGAGTSAHLRGRTPVPLWGTGFPAAGRPGDAAEGAAGRAR